MTTIVPGELIPAATINEWCPPGMVVDYAGSVAPSGWLICDGASYLRADYPELFTAISTTYGAADGTHFNIPDCRGRVSIGIGTHADVDALNDNDGETVGNRRPKHKHVVTGGADGFVGGGGFGSGSSGQTITPILVGPQTAAPTDAPAYIVLNKIIRATD